MNCFQTSDILLELRESLAQECTEILRIKCDADMIKVGTDFADVVLRVAFFYTIDAGFAAQALCEHIETTTTIMRKAESVGKYINITLSDEYLLKIAHTLIENYPFPESLNCNKVHYAVARAAMMTKMDDDFFIKIKNKFIRRAFYELLKSDNDGSRRATEYFLSAERKLVCYDGMKTIADATARVLYNNGREIIL